MDRKLDKGVIGLACAWIDAAGSEGKLSHDLMKNVLSHEDSLATRTLARGNFTDMAKEKGGVYADIIAEELKLRGTSDELVGIRCAPL